MSLTRTIEFGTIDRSATSDALIPATLATSAGVDRYGVLEVLDCTTTGVDLSRAPLPLIVAHDNSKLSIGLVEQVQARGDKITGMVRFSTSPEAQQIRADVVAGIHRSLSVGYKLLDAGTPIDRGFLYRWQPHEVSIVPIPADPQSGFFRSQPSINTMTQTTTQPTPATQTREADILALCKRHSVPELANGLISEGATIEAARSAILNELATRDEASGGHRNVNIQNFNSPDSERSILINTLVARLGGKPNGEIIRSTDCTGLAIRTLELAGHKVSHRDSRDQIITRAMTTGDFTNLLGNAAGRVLAQSFDETPAVLKQVARLVNMPDFKSRSVIRLPGGAPSLELVNEHGEFKYGGINEVANGWSLKTYGRIVTLSRQAMINDDLDAFAGLLTEFGKSAARREADLLTAMLTGTPQIDAGALFDAGKNTLISGVGSVLAAAGLAAAVLAMRTQKETGGGYVNQEPRYLIVPAALETTARQLVATITPNTTASVQPYGLTVIVEPRLDAASATAWYLVSGNQGALEYGYLDGAIGPQTFTEEGFDVDGTSIKCRLDFGTGWVSPIGWVKSAGA